MNNYCLSLVLLKEYKFRTQNLFLLINLKKQNLPNYIAFYDFPLDMVALT